MLLPAWVLVTSATTTPVPRTGTTRSSKCILLVYFNVKCVHVKNKNFDFLYNLSRPIRGPPWDRCGSNEMRLDKHGQHMLSHFWTVFDQRRSFTDWTL